jgi:hypothetical protein
MINDSCLCSDWYSKLFLNNVKCVYYVTKEYTLPINPKCIIFTLFYSVCLVNEAPFWILVSIMSRLWGGWSGVVQNIQTSYGTTQPPLEWVPRVVPTVIDWSGHEANISHPASTKVKNGWSYNCSPCMPSFLVQGL